MKTQPKVDASYIETFSFDGNNGSGEYLDMGQNMTNTYLNAGGLGKSTEAAPTAIVSGPRALPANYVNQNPYPLPLETKPMETQKTSPFALFKSGGLVPIPTPLGAVVLIGALGLGIWGISKLLK